MDIENNFKIFGYTTSDNNKGDVCCFYYLYGYVLHKRVNNAFLFFDRQNSRYVNQTYLISKYNNIIHNNNNK